MAHLPNTQLAALRLSEDKKWLRCNQCSAAYWGAFRPTDFVKSKFDAHVERKHKPEQEAGAEAPAAAQLPAQPKAPKAPKAQAKANAKAARKGDGPLRIVRAAGPSTADLLGQDVAALLNELELAPRLQLAQGPRNFSDEGNNRFDGPRKARDAGKGQDVVARVQAQLSPLKGWA
jgi:hypothetical protein